MLAVGLVLWTGCSSGAAPSATERSPSAAATVSASPSPARCPNPHGGSCLGDLTAGTYTTLVMETPLTYTVPDGWANFEDLPGNFLLVPPGGSLEGVDAGTSDYVGVYDGAVAASADCEEHAQDGVDATAEAMAAWFAGLEGVEVTEPIPVTLGGLDGFMVDLSIDEDSPARCPYPGLEDLPTVPILIGDGPASLHHGVNPGFLFRLYLLDGDAGRPIAIEVIDVSGGTGLAEIDAVLRSFRFGTDG